MNTQEHSPQPQSLHEIDVTILSSQTGLSNEEASKLLVKYDGDIVNAIIHFFSPSYNENETLNKSFTNEVPKEIGELREMMKDSVAFLETRNQLQLVPETTETENSLDEIEEKLHNLTVD